MAEIDAVQIVYNALGLERIGGRRPKPIGALIDLVREGYVAANKNGGLLVTEVRWGAARTISRAWG